MVPREAGPAAGLDPGLDAGFLPRDPVPGQQGRAGSGFTSGHAFDTSLPGPSLAQALDAATAGTGAGGYRGLDDDELIGVLAGWAKTEGWAAAGRLAAVAELAARGSLSNLLCELGQLSSFCYITVGSFWCSGQTGTRSPNATENAFMAAFQP